MVKVKLYDVDECIKTGDWPTEWEHYFDWELMCPTLFEKVFIPFRDEESVRLLKETWDIEFIDNRDWYSVRCDGVRMNVRALNNDLKFALVTIFLSRKGRYTTLGYADERVWRVLADLDMDILVAMKVQEMGIYSPEIEGINYKIINFPYKGQTIEVDVLNERVSPGKKGLYEWADESRDCGMSKYLCVGKDGRFYMDIFYVGYAFQYYWKNDIEGIIKYIDRVKKDKTYLVDVRRTFDIFEMMEFLGEYLNCFEGDCEPLESSEEYVYFKEKFKIITHMRTLPKSAVFRKLPQLIVERNHDGSYFIHGGLTVKFPAFHEMLEDAIDRRSPDKESFILIVDEEELLNRASDIERTICGFRVQADSVDVYEAEDAIQLFGEALREAHYSSSCTIDGEFY